MVTSKKASKPAPRVVRAASRSVATRHRSHTLAPPHLGEVPSVATLAIGIGGVALLITAVAIVVNGLTLGSQYTDPVPPNVGQLGTGQVVGGIALLLLSMLIVGAATAVFLDIRGARRAAIGLGALTTALCVGAILLVMTGGGGDRLLAFALLVTAILFAASTIILVRVPRPDAAG